VSGISKSSPSCSPPKLEETVKYIANRDLKVLQGVLEDVFKIHTDINILRVYATDLGMEQFTQDCCHLSHYKAILDGREEYIPYEDPIETTGKKKK
jgi:hypothetical protein